MATNESLTNKRKVMLPHTMGKQGIEVMQARDDIETIIYPAGLGQAELLPRLVDISGIALSGTPFRQPEIDAAPVMQAVARIGVGYDGGSEAEAALELGATIAAAAGAELHVRAVVDDRIRSIGWSRLGTGPVIVPEFGWSAIGSQGVTPGWDEVVQTTVSALRVKVADAARATAEKVETDVQRGRPANALLELSQEVDLLVIGSRRWGPVARVILGTTGEALLHDASCPVLVAPRPKP